MNYYEILKLSPNASKQQIKSSYKKLVKKYHPDLYVGDKEFAEQKIKEINEAYDTLSNPEKKLLYDETLNSIFVNEIISSSIHQNTVSDLESEIPKTSFETEVKWSFSKFITEKLNGLDKKRQLQIFGIVFLLILMLFLINLIEVQYYLNNTLQNPDFTANTNTTFPENFTENNFIENEFDTQDLPVQDDFKMLDSLFYDLFPPSNTDLFSEMTNETEFTF